VTLSRKRAQPERALPILFFNDPRSPLLARSGQKIQQPELVDADHDGWVPLLRFRLSVGDFVKLNSTFPRQADSAAHLGIPCAMAVRLIVAVHLRAGSGRNMSTLIGQFVRLITE
jgi:hypothetical protein